MIGFHLQQNTQNWPDALQYLPDNTIIKLVDDVQRASEVKSHNQNLKVWVRHHVNEQNPSGDLEHMKHQARDFFNSFIDATFMQPHISGNVDYVSEYNEYFADSQSQEERDRWIRWSLACAMVWNTEYRAIPELSHIKLILAETAVGNDIPVDTARYAIDYDCLLGYHSYIPVYNDEIHPQDWEFYSGRWVSMDNYYFSLGLDTSRLYWVAGEYGAVGLTIPPSGGQWPNALDGGAGWLASTTYNGDVNKFNQMHAYFLDRVSGWNGQNDDRFLGATIFTTGGGSQWQLFELSQPHLNTVAQFIGSYAPSPVPPDPEPPDPPPVTYKVVVNLLPQDATIHEKILVINYDEVHENKETVLQSADDAGRLAAGGNDDSFVRVWWPDRWDGNIIDYLQSNYAVSVTIVE